MERGGRDALDAAEAALRESGPLMAMGSQWSERLDAAVRQLAGCVVKMASDMTAVQQRLGACEKHLKRVGVRIQDDFAMVSERIGTLEAGAEAPATAHRPDDRIVRLEQAVAAHKKRLDDLASSLGPPPKASASTHPSRALSPAKSATFTPASVHSRSFSAGTAAQRATADASVLSDSTGLPTTSLTELRKMHAWAKGSAVGGVAVAQASDQQEQGSIPPPPPSLEGESAASRSEADSRSSSGSSMPLPRRGSAMRPAAPQVGSGGCPPQPGSRSSLRSTASWSQAIPPAYQGYVPENFPEVI